MKRDYLAELIDERQELEVCAEDIKSAFEIMRDCYRNGGKLLVCGNGGSAADSEHIVGELMKEFMKKRPLSSELSEKLKEQGEEGERLSKSLQAPLPAISLCGLPAFSTAFQNDADPAFTFAQQVLGYGKEGDVLLGLSTSGNSENVVMATRTAKALGLSTVALTGESGGKLKELCDVCIRVPSNSTPKIQEMHLPIYHALCAMLEEEFF